MKTLFVICVTVCAVVCFGQITTAVNPEEPDADIAKHVTDCLKENNLDIGILGITKIDELEENSFVNLKTVPEEKKNCFVACIYQKRGLITKEGTLIEEMPQADPKKKFETSFEDEMIKCRAEKDFCKLGGCLFGIYLV